MIQFTSENPPLRTFACPLEEKHPCRSEGVDIPTVLMIRIIYVFLQKRENVLALPVYLGSRSSEKNKKTSIYRGNIRYLNLKAMPLPVVIFVALFSTVFRLIAFSVGCSLLIHLNFFPRLKVTSEALPREKEVLR